MTQFDETITSPPPSPSPEHMQLQKISSHVDTTISEFTSLQQHVHDMIAHICGLKWYQHTCRTKLSYLRWKDLQNQASQLTYKCAGIDEALMRHLFSLDAITGDDTIRTIRRACVHRIKQSISEVEKYTTYMYRAQYWCKKWIHHDEEEAQMETETTTTEPMSPSTSETSPATKPSTTPMSPPTKSSTLHPPTTKTRSNSTSFPHHTSIKSRSTHASPLQTSRSLSSSPALKTKKLSKPSPTLKPTTGKSPVRSPTLPSKSPLSKLPVLSPLPKSAPASPVLPTRHLSSKQPLPRTPSSPRFKVSHDSTHITITALLPGVPRDSLDVTIRGHLLRITGVLMGESFVREMELPETCDVDQLDAAWEEETDTLKIRVPIVKPVKSQPVRTSRPQPSQPQSRYMEDQEMDDDEDRHSSHPYYSRPMNYSSRCAPSYMHPSYPSYSRHPLYVAPPRNMFGSPFGGFW